MLKVEIIGNIGNDAEIKEFGGKKYVSFSVAHTEYQKDEQGNRTDLTTWCSVLWFGEGGRLTSLPQKRGKGLCSWKPQSKDVYRQKWQATSRNQCKCIRGSTLRGQG